MHDGILETIVGAIFLGILAQVLASCYKLPAILPLARPALEAVRLPAEDPAAARDKSDAGGAPEAAPG